MHFRLNSLTKIGLERKYTNLPFSEINILPSSNTVLVCMPVEIQEKNAFGIPAISNLHGIKSGCPTVPESVYGFSFMPSSKEAPPRKIKTVG